MMKHQRISGLFAAALCAAALGQENPGAESCRESASSRTLGQPPITQYTYQNDVATDIADSESYRSRKISRWYHFKAGHLVLEERDLDGDGKAEFRVQWEPDPQSSPELDLVYIAGRYRIIPQYFQTKQGGKSQRLVDGKWTGTFEDKIKAAENAKAETFRRFVDGELVESTYDAPDGYMHLIKEPGKPQRIERGPRKGWITSFSEFFDNSTVITNFEGEKELSPSRRYIYVLRGLTITEKYEDGKWLRDFEELAKDSLGRPSYRNVYRNGVCVAMEAQGGQYTTSQYFTRNPDGTYTNEYNDYKGGLWRIAGGNLGITSYEMKIKGQWQRDFVYELNAGEICTYKDGRLVRQERPAYPQMNRVISFPTPDTMEVGDGKQVQTWEKFELGLGGHRRLLSKSIDTDGDGKPDIEADFVKFTIKQPVNPAPPWTPPPPPSPYEKAE